MARSDVRRRALALLLAPLALAVGGCTEIDNALASVPFFAFMRESPSYDPYEMTRPAPPGAVPFASPLGAHAEAAVELRPGGLEAFAAQLPPNPVPATPATLAAGEALYARYCTVCHGPLGAGNGPVVGPGKYPFAANLTISPAIDREEAYVYAVIKAGRGLMPAYGQRVGPTERWLIVNYVRYLQRLLPPGAVPDTAAAPSWARTLPETPAATAAPEQGSE